MGKMVWSYASFIAQPGAPAREPTGTRVFVSLKQYHRDTCLQRIKGFGFVPVLRRARPGFSKNTLFIFFRKGMIKFIAQTGAFCRKAAGW